MAEQKKYEPMFRDLREDEIQVRVQSASEKGVIALLYKDARCDMNILDTVGRERWQREHYECKGNLFCRVGIKYEDEWIWKSDCGSESNTDPEKGEASDSFKRACTNHGIGRELYTSPFIWINAADCKKLAQDTRDPKKWKCGDHFIVEKIKIENKKITGLSIINTTNANKRVFVWTAAKASEKGEK